MSFEVSLLSHALFLNIFLYALYNFLIANILHSATIIIMPVICFINKDMILLEVIFNFSSCSKLLIDVLVHMLLTLKWLGKKYCQ